MPADFLGAVGFGVQRDTQDPPDAHGPAQRGQLAPGGRGSNTMSRAPPCSGERDVLLDPHRAGRDQGRGAAGDDEAVDVAPGRGGAGAAGADHHRGRGVPGLAEAVRRRRRPTGLPAGGAAVAAAGEAAGRGGEELDPRAAVPGGAPALPRTIQPRPARVHPGRRPRRHPRRPRDPAIAPPTSPDPVAPDRDDLGPVPPRTRPIVRLDADRRPVSRGEDPALLASLPHPTSSGPDADGVVSRGEAPGLVPHPDPTSSGPDADGVVSRGEDPDRSRVEPRPGGTPIRCLRTRTCRRILPDGRRGSTRRVPRVAPPPIGAGPDPTDWPVARAADDMARGGAGGRRSRQW